LAKDSARDVVASEQASAIRPNNFTTMCFMVVSPFGSIHQLDIQQLPKSYPVIFSIGRGAKTLMQIKSRRS
jgi:hypothetical protein